MNLVQEKLNVNVKKRANLFNWRGQFTPEFVEYIIESFNCTKDSIILDPFAGSGTVLIESAIKDIPNVGFEINPAAFHMANFYKYSNLELKERQELVLSLEFGSNRKNRGNRLLTVIQYCIDMEESLFSFWNSLKENGKLVMVVGRESNVRKTPFYNGEIVLELINEMNCFIIIDKSERAFLNKFGKKIIEDIIIVEKKALLQPTLNVARKIAKSHLTKAKKNAPTEVEIDFIDAINKINIVSLNNKPEIVLKQKDFPMKKEVFMMR